MPEDKKAPAGDMVTTYTIGGVLYGVDQENKTWQRTANGAGWKEPEKA